MTRTVTQQPSESRRLGSLRLTAVRLPEPRPQPGLDEKDSPDQYSPADHWQYTRRRLAAAAVLRRRKPHTCPKPRPVTQSRIVTAAKVLWPGLAQGTQGWPQAFRVRCRRPGDRGGPGSGSDWAAAAVTVGRAATAAPTESLRIASLRIAFEMRLRIGGG